MDGKNWRNMKRIKIYQEISKIVAKEYISKDHGIKEIVKFIQNNYRRREHKKKGYFCHECGITHQVGCLCKERGKIK